MHIGPTNQRVLSTLCVCVRLRAQYTQFDRISGAESWFAEYKRLLYNVPLVLTEDVRVHAHQVLHVSSSHGGRMFATCSKDGQLIVSRRRRCVQLL